MSNSYLELKYNSLICRNNARDNEGILFMASFILLMVIRGNKQLINFPKYHKVIAFRACMGCIYAYTSRDVWPQAYHVP